jgi:hypothetical protein
VTGISVTVHLRNFGDSALNSCSEEFR